MFVNVDYMYMYIMSIIYILLSQKYFIENSANIFSIGFKETEKYVSNVLTQCAVFF